MDYANRKFNFLKMQKWVLLVTGLVVIVMVYTTIEQTKWAGERNIAKVFGQKIPIVKKLWDQVMAKDEEDENDDLNYSDPNDDCTEVENFQAYDIRVADHGVLYFSVPKSINSSANITNSNSKLINKPSILSNSNVAGINVKNASNVLKVFVVLQSHIDPGWLKTFEDYFTSQVRSILDKSVLYLSIFKDLRFIWSEMSFLHRWWKDATPEQKKNLTILINEGRFELCGGSWVMTDEATPYFWATIDNLIEGHQFVKNIFNFTPKSSWSVDPFGHGLMMPYLFHETGVNQLVIGRINNHVKGSLREKGLLNYRWAQAWDKDASINAPLVNMLPRTYYTTSDACGPDSSVCCQFDLGPSARSFCAARANNVSAQNVEHFSDLLSGQYRKLQPFYGGNSVLISVGDDFFFSNDRDWTETQTNYAKIFDYINKNPKYNMKVQFSTVSEYFASLREENRNLPFLTGDFFPYTEDKTGSHPYWTGFYVHRPFFKRFERVVQAQLRSYDLMSVLTSSNLEIPQKIQEARQNLAVCQHHDSITGTSKPPVMKDYLLRLQSATESILNAKKSIISRSTTSNKTLTAYKIPVEGKNEESSDQHLIAFNDVDKEHDLIIFNQVTFGKKFKISVLVNDPRTLVTDDSGGPILAQILPVYNFSVWRAPDFFKFKLIFYLHLEPLGTKVVNLKWVPIQPETTILSKLYSTQIILSNFTNTLLSKNDFTLKNGLLSVDFKNGLVENFQYKESNLSYPLKISYAKYGDRGGAYTFVSTTAKQLFDIPNSTNPPIYAIGPLCSEAVSKIDNQIIQMITINNAEALLDNAIELDIFSNVEKMGETSILNIETKIENQGKFFTDTNGIYFIERNFNKTVTIDGNFYPVATSSFLEDSKVRLNILTGQPTGATSSEPGILELMIDRRLAGDDGKGLGGGDASQSPPSRLRYRLLLEQKLPSEQPIPSQPPIFHSSKSYFSLHQLLYPPDVFITSLEDKSQLDSLGFPSLEWPCDIELIHLRLLDEKSVLVLIRRLPYDCSFAKFSCGADNIDILWQALKRISENRTLVRTTLTGNQDFEPYTMTTLQEKLLVPLQIVAFKFYLN